MPPGVGNVDVFGPQVTGVAITTAPAYNLFDPKEFTHGALGPTPLVNGLTISFKDLPARAPGFVYPALDPATASTRALMWSREMPTASFRSRRSS